MMSAKKKSAKAKSKSQDFFEKVWLVACEIPEGRVTTYGDIAEFLGIKGSARMVGWALNGVSDRREVPAHRVINRNGLLTGKHHFETPTVMKERLMAEGITFLDDDQVDIAKFIWKPIEELPSTFRQQLQKTY